MITKKILKDSEAIDNKFDTMDQLNIQKIFFSFRVPNNHPRHNKISHYLIVQGEFDEILGKVSEEICFIIDNNVSKISFIQKFINLHKDCFLLTSEEGNTKTISFLNHFIKSNLYQKKYTTLVVIGGGLLTNCGAYIAEQLQIDLILVPTTVLSMADNSGGKVRINTIQGNNFYKHSYKSFYEPNQIIIDKRFLMTINQHIKKIGLVEIIKHSLFQSKKLYDYLLENTDNILHNNAYLLKAILRTIDLKRICIEYDIDENEYGSKKILRAGHDISDKIEETMQFSIPHGYAVSIGLYQEAIQSNN
ncbi:MAG TPA: hypothetical protein PLW93_05900, partial [Candidatus Absconditabacterales bacterium]|nr:hypothetical protein [Candidatus Absconditabacterales bacterium]